MGTSALRDVPFVLVVFSSRITRTNNTCVISNICNKNIAAAGVNADSVLMSYNTSNYNAFATPLLRRLAATNITQLQ